MIKRLVAWLNEEEDQREPIDLNLASAVLLVEVGMADHEWQQEESERIRQLLITELGLDAGQADDIVMEACARVEDSHDLFQFTNLINEQFTTDQKYALLVNLWKVALADGNIDQYEDHIIRKIAELMYLHHSHFIRAKQDAQSQDN